jgi:TolA-binding protein
MRRTFLLIVALSFAAPTFAQVDPGADDFAFAAGLHDRGLHDRAARAFEGFLNQWPKDARAPKARFHLAQSLVAIGRDEDALKQLDLYIESKDRELLNEAQLRAGEIEHRIGRSNDATKRLQALARSKNLGDLEEPVLYFLGEAANAASNAKVA